MQGSNTQSSLCLPALPHAYIAHFMDEDGHVLKKVQEDESDMILVKSLLVLEDEIPHARCVIVDSASNQVIHDLKRRYDF